MIRRFVGVLGLAVLLGGTSVSAQLPSPVVFGRPVPALDVPYLPQSVLLCGGAALAMVERYWGRRGVYAEDFAALVERDRGGIGTRELSAAARDRGWEVAAFDATPEQLQYLLSNRIPVIVLIEVAPKRYHYIVLLEWAEGRVRFHDPARAPNMVWTEAEFLRRWDGGARWAMTVRPSPTAAPKVDSTSVAAATDSLPCPPLLDQAIDASAANLLDDAAGLLTTAQQRCPDVALVLREFAGVRFRQRRYDQSLILSEAYVARAPEDTLGWRILAVSRYLTGDPAGALTAFNRIGEPTVDLVRIDGLRRTRFTVVRDAIGLRPQTLLTPERQTMAQRRVDDIPALYRGHVGYQPADDGLAEVRAVVAERPMIEPVLSLLVGNVLRGLTREEVDAAVAGPLGAGELWSASARWDHANPRYTFDLAVPMRVGWPGVIAVDGTWETFRFDTGLEETRRAGGFGFGAWVTPAFRPSLELRLDRWNGDRTFLATAAAGEYRLSADRLTLLGEVEHGVAFGEQADYSRGGVRAQWASAHLLQRTLWSLRGGVELAEVTTPAGRWPVANGDVQWALPLRAHPYNENDLLPTGTTGRRIVHGGAAIDQPFYQTPFLSFALGAFVDAARISERLSGGRERTFVDVGGGLRIGLLGGQLGVLRIDLATGVNDDATALTVGLHRRWPL